MARGVNDIHIIGNLGADPEMRNTGGGTKVCNLRVAVSRSGGKDKEEVTDWFRVVVWGDLAETCDRYLRKGAKVYFRGEMRSGKYTPKDTDIEVTSWELNAFQMQMLDSRADSEGRDDDRPRGRDRDDDRGGRDRDRGERDRDRDRDRGRDTESRSSSRRSRDDDDEEDEPAPPKSRSGSRDSSRYSERR